MTSPLEPFHVGGEPYSALNSHALSQITDDLNLYGLVLISDLVTRSNARAAADRILDIMRQQPDSRKPDQHLSDILDHLDPSDYPLFAEMLAHPICLGIARSVLGTGFQLTEPGARLRKPGAPAGPIHASAPLEKFATAGLPVPNISFILGFSWMLNDLKAEMGATAYMPFSHRAARYPGPESGRQYLIPIEARAGSVVIYHQALWHGFTANSSKTDRFGFMGGYCASWVDPVAVGYHVMKKRVRDRMPEAVRNLNERVSD